MSFDWALTFEVAFDTDPGDEPGAGDWTDLSDRIRRPPASSPVTVEYGPGRLEGAGEGRCTLTLDNRDRAIDPTNPSATLNLVPMRHARLSVTYDSTDYDLFRGFVDDWPPVWWVVDSDVRVELVDAFAWLGLQDADVDRPREMSHERVTALLDAAGWPAGLRDISDGVVELEPFEQVGANLLRTLLDTADAEGGDLYVAPDGKVTSTSRHGRFGTTAAVTFGPDDIGIADSEPLWDTARLTNVARFERADGDVFEVVDDASVTKYGTRDETVRDLPLRDAEAEAVAQWIVVRFADQHLWVRDLRSHGHVDALPDVLNLRVGHLTRVIHPLTEDGTAQPILDEAGDPILDEGGQQILDEGSTVDRVDKFLAVDKIRHEINAAEAEWHAFVDLSPHFGAGPWFTWDDPDRGWDMGAKWAP